MNRRPSPRSAFLAAMLGLAAVLTIAAACSPVVDYRGYVPDKAKLDEITLGADTKATIAQRLGTPSIVGTFDSDVWYYVSSKEQSLAFFEPETIERQVVALRFDEQNIVIGIDRYTAADARSVSIVSRETPTRGKELTFFEQMFGNLGRLPAPGSQ